MRRIVVFLVVLAGVLAAADRIAAWLASQQVAVEAARAAPACSRPGVDIHGFPFLTQAIAGHYEHVTLTTSCTGAVALQQVRVDLYGVHLGLGQIVHQDVERVPVDRATGRLTIPFRSLDRTFAGQRLTFGRGRGRTITVTGSLSLGGATISAHGAGSVGISGGNLRITVDSVSTPLGTISSGGALDVTVPLPPLPFHITGARVAAGTRGVVIEASARRLVLQKPPG